MLWLGLALITVLILLWVAIRVFRNNKPPELGLSPRKTLMDKLVRDYKAQFERALGEDYDIYPHVRLADLLVSASQDGKQARDILSRVESTSTDFVLTEKASGQIACVLILIHHGTLGSRQQFIRRICQQSQLPFVIFDVHNALSDKQIRQKVTSTLEPTIVLDEPSAGDIKVYLDPAQRKDKQQAELDV